MLLVGDSCQPVCAPGFTASGPTTCEEVTDAPPVLTKTRCVEDTIIECEVTPPVDGTLGDCPSKLPNGEDTSLSEWG